MTSSERVHQILFRRRNNEMVVTCLCLAVFEKHDRTVGGDYYESMERLSGHSLWQTYNIASNHSAPFTDEDKILWR